MPAGSIRELDVVEMLTTFGRWPAGTRGTVVAADDSMVLVEISDGAGHGDDFVSVPRDIVALAHRSV